MLFSESLDPLFSSFGLIQIDACRAAADYESWMNDVLSASGIRARLHTERLRVAPIDALGALLPLVSPPTRTRFLFLSTSSSWSLFLDNCSMGTDAVGVAAVLAKRLRCKAMHVVAQEPTISNHPNRQGTDTWGAMILELYTESGLSRSIGVVNDGGRWVFDQCGIPLSFEDTDAYRRRRIRDRLTKSMLIKYLAELDAHPFASEWYQQDAYLVRRGDL